MEGITKSKKLTEILGTKLDESKLLDEIGQLFGGRTLSHLKNLSIDSTISRCLKESSKTGDFFLENTLLITSHLLPRLPPHIEEMFGQEQSSGLKLSQGECPEFTERLMKKIIDKIFGIFYKRCYEGRNHPNHLYLVFFQILSFASSSTLSEALDERFAFYAHNFLQPKCMTLNRIYIQAVFIITERLPAYSKENILTTNNVFQIRRVSEFSKEAEEFFEKHRLDDILSINHLAWKTLRRVCCKFSKGENAKAFETLCDILKQRIATPMELIGSKFIYHLQEFLTCSLENDEDLKMFFKIVTRFSRQSYDECSYDSSMFKQLVDYVKTVLKWIHTKWEFLPDHECSPCMDRNYGKAYYEVQMDEAVLVMECLRYSNDYFHKFLDINPTFQLLESKEFDFHFTTSSPTKSCFK